jgi:hypothetical protein
VIKSLRLLDVCVVVGVLLAGGGARGLVGELGQPGFGPLEVAAALAQIAVGAWLGLWALRRATRLRVTKAIERHRGSPSA